MSKRGFIVGGPVSAAMTAAIVGADMAVMEDRYLADMKKPATDDYADRRFRIVDLQLDEFPDRLCTEPSSKFFIGSSAPYVGVRIAGVESADVVEYCRSGRWVRIGIRGEDGKLERDYKAKERRYKANQQFDVDIEVFWKQSPSRQVKRALKRIGEK